jgi:hypothetical protein
MLSSQFPALIRLPGFHPRQMLATARFTKAFLQENSNHTKMSKPIAKWF